MDNELPRNPFPLDGPDGFCWVGPSQSHVLDLLHHLSQLSDLLLIVSGPAGAGKTTLLDELLRRGGEQWRHCLIGGAPNLGPDDVLSRLLAGFRLPLRETSLAARERLLEDHLRALHHGNVVVVIAVDDADRLPRRSREYLLDLVERWEALRISLVLTSVVPAVQLLEVQGQTDRIHHIELAALSESETREYLEARMRRAGLDTGVTDADVRSMHAQSRGIPGAMHRCARSLLTAADREASPPSSTHEARPGPAFRAPGLVGLLGLLGGAVMLTAVAGWLLLRGPARERPDSPVIAAAPPLATAATQPPPADADASTDSQSSSPGALQDDEDTSLGAPPDPDRPAAATIARAFEDPQVAPRLAVPLESPPVVSSRGETREAVTTQADGGTVASIPGREAEAAPLKPPEVASQSPPPASAVSSGSTPTSVPSHVRDLSWLRQLDPSQFAIQLMASHDPADIGRFMADQRLTEDLAWFKTTHEERDWYVLVTGPYPSRETAGAAAEALPKALQRQGPWPRRISDIVQTARP